MRNNNIFVNLVSAKYRHSKESETEDPRVSDADQIELSNNDCIRSEHENMSHTGVVHIDVRTDQESEIVPAIQPGS